MIRSCIDEQGLAMGVVCERLKGMPLKVVRYLSTYLSIYVKISLDFRNIKLLPQVVKTLAKYHLLSE